MSPQVPILKLTLGVAAALLVGCAVHADNEWPYEHHHYGDERGVPSGHLPPPGECRIWYPDRPAGQQPPPGDCRELQSRVPRGAYLIEG